MEAKDLAPEAAEKMYIALRPAFEYLVALQHRMEERQFAYTDRLYLEVKAARDNMQLLCHDLHKLACHNFYPKGDGKVSVGKPP